MSEGRSVTAPKQPTGSPAYSAVIGAAWKPFAVWTALIGVGLVLLYFRYDWDLGEGRYAERGFLLSAFLFALTLPTTYYLARRLLISSVAAGLVTAAVFVLTTLPWTLLGLDELAYYADRPRAFLLNAVPNPPALEFLPGGTLRTFPYDYAFMPLLLGTGIGLVWGVRWIRERAGGHFPRRIAVLLTIAFGAICVQTYLHTSMRAPYTYLALFQKPEKSQHWYHVYHFADGTGASEADQFVFTPLEEYFQGAPADGNNMLARRPYSFWVTSQVSYFINTFYVWLGFNCLFWLAAVAATGRWVGRVTTPRTGLIAAALVTVSPGFIAFVGTTAMYMQAFAVVMIALCLFEDLIVRGRRRTADFALFAAALAVCMLVYDMLPLAVSLIVYGIAREVRWKPLVLAIVAAIVVSRVFPMLLTVVLSTPIDDTNSAQLTRGLEGVRDLFLSPGIHEWYVYATDLVPRFAQQLLQAFFVIPTVLAIFGWRLLKDRPLRLLILSLLVTGFAVIAVLVIGRVIVGTAPRMVFPIFPAVYLLAAVALARIRLPGRWPQAAPWITIAVMAILVNVDIFGYPTPYYEFFIGSPPRWVP